MGLLSKSSRPPSQTVLIFFSGYISHELAELIDQVRDESLGEPGTRGPNKSYVGPDGKWHDGTRWERSSMAKNVNNAPRCYPIAQSYQVQRNMTGPTEKAKTSAGLREHHILRQRIAEVGSDGYGLAWSIPFEYSYINLYRLGL